MDRSFLAQVDALVADFFAGWDRWSTLIFTLIVVILGYSFFFTGEEDIHSYFLARQASESPVRLENESATYRNLDTPHGYPLRRGLDIIDPDAPKWTSGRIGDLRDIWLSFAKGAVDKDGRSLGIKSEIRTVLGRFVKAHSAEEITRQIEIIGKDLAGDKYNDNNNNNNKGHSHGRTVVVCLSSSVELLATVFASAFYGFKIVLVPSDISARSLGEILRDVKADTLFAEAGSTDLLVLLEHTHALRNVVWVVRGGSEDVDWTETPKIAYELRVTTWSELMKTDTSNGIGSLLDHKEVTPPPITMLWSKEDGSGVLVECDQQNLVSGTAAVAAGLTRRQRLTPSDTVLIVDHLSRPYPLAVLLAALYSNASIALGSVAGNRVNLALASEVVSPTVIAATSEAVHDFYAEYLSPSSGILTRIGCFLRQISLDRGVFPANGGTTRLTSLSLAPSVRLLLISQRVDGDIDSILTPQVLSDLRTVLGVRVVYALTAPYVFGAISQTNPFDYRRGVKVHFGPPASSLELKVVDGSGGKQVRVGETVMEGDIHVSGPSVSGGNRNLGVPGRINEDYTLSLA
ncbi:hypothetical protein KEM54_005661 [Ascosphaera aggregata]|nr:hypothetical protein KEM54_005661 [Ascosphaera aggregata]